MSEVDLTRWIDSNIKRVEDPDDASMYLIDLLNQILYCISKEQIETPYESKEAMIYDMIKRTDMLWVYAGAHMESKYGVQLMRYGAIVLLKTIKIKDESNGEILHEQLDQYVEDLDKKISHTKPNIQPSLLKEYFQLFRELETYHVDVADYPDEESRVKGKRIAEIYAQLMGGA